MSGFPLRPDIIETMQGYTRARIGVGKAGPRCRTGELLSFRVDHAAARDAIYDEVSDEVLAPWNCERIQTLAAGKQQYLLRPDLGRRFDEKNLSRLQTPEFSNQQVLILIGDGLSAAAVDANLGDLLPSLHVGLQKHGLTCARPIFVRFARVGAMDPLGEALRPEAVVYLIGERPGLRAAVSLSAYMCFRPNASTVESNRDVVSNIHKDGLPPLEAGAVISDWVKRYIDNQASGMKLRRAAG